MPRRKLSDEEKWVRKIDRENTLRGVAPATAPTVFRSKWMQGIRE